jgi:hypothetical protein
MDPQRMKDAYERVRSLDERLGARLPRRDRGGFARPGVEQLEEQVRTLTTYTVELREIVEELFLAIASPPRSVPPTGGGTA